MVQWFGFILSHINHCRLFNAKSFLYIYIKYMGFGLVLVLWHINHCILFAKSFLYIYIKYIWFGLVLVLWHINDCSLFNVKSFLYIYIGFGLVLWHINHCWLYNDKYFIYIHILNIWFLNTFITFWTQFNVFKYCYVSLTIQLNISHLFTRT